MTDKIRTIRVVTTDKAGGGIIDIKEMEIKRLKSGKWNAMGQFLLDCIIEELSPEHVVTVHEVLKDGGSTIGIISKE